MEKRKTLNDHLFDQLERLSSATDETINLETDKATHIIAVSEQVLNVAKLKIDIMQLTGSNQVIQEQFAEIDEPETFKALPAPVEDNDEAKKKD